jgi:hypothetical protein
MDDMTEMIARRVAGLGNVGRSDHLTFVDGAKHQHTGGEVCSYCQAHGAVPMALMNY